MSGIDRVLIAVEMRRIRKEYGQLKPQFVLKEAEPHNAPLHNMFEWDDSIAGHEFRLEQARRLIKITVTIEHVGHQDIVVPTYISERNNDGTREYVPVHEVMSDKQRRLSMVIDAITRARDIVRNCPDPTTQFIADQLDLELQNL